MNQSLAIRTAPFPLGAAGLVVLYANEGGAPEGAAAAGWEQTGLDFAPLSAAAWFTGKQGQVLDIPAPAGLAANRLFVLGAGKVDPARPPAATAWADRGGSLAGKIASANTDNVGVVRDEVPAAAVAE